MIRWQIACQSAWLDAVRPHVVAWPWENHSWERALVRAARVRGIRTVGYQHTVVGPHQYNQSPRANRDGLDSVPDVIVCSGEVWRDDLMRNGIPADRLVVGGAFRLRPPPPGLFQPGAPILVLLPYDTDIASDMMEAVCSVTDPSLTFVVRPHPMYPYPVPKGARISRTDLPLHRQPALSGVLYATGTAGLEALLGGLPTFRYCRRGHFTMDILPSGISPVDVTRDNLDAALSRPIPPPAIAIDSIAAPIDLSLWRRLLSAGPAGHDSLAAACN